MDEQEKVIFVTDDKWLLQKGGVLDNTDREIIAQMEQAGQVVFMSPKETFEAMQNEEPEKFDEFKKQLEIPGTINLTIDDIVELSRQGEIKSSGFYEHVQILMTKRQAKTVRNWRIDCHFTWRAVARSAFAMVISRQWYRWGSWEPASNQLMGVALCKRAAELLNENYRKPPWN